MNIEYKTVLFNKSIYINLLICIFAAILFFGCTSEDEKGEDPSVNPVANAGQDASVPVNVAFTLDGSGSTGTGPLKYLWNIVQDNCLPGGSLINPETVNPIFTPTSQSTCIFTLEVTDAAGIKSNLDTVTITATIAPAANAGQDAATPVSVSYTLDGSGCSGVAPLSYTWTITDESCFPGGSLINPNTSSPTFIPTSENQCTFSLKITDANGYDSSPDSVVITATEKPVSNAGVDKPTPVNVVYTLDGGASSGILPLSYDWTIEDDTCFPGGSLINPTTVNPSFTPTVIDSCEFSLIVTDGNGFESSSDSILITSTQEPVANAGPDANAPVNVVYSLNGTASSGVAPLTYSWTINNDSCFPGGTLSDLSSDSPTFTPTQQDQCIFSLEVTDANGYSSTLDAVIITATEAPIANVGSNQGAPVNLVYTLNGSLSSGVAPLSFSWSIDDDACFPGGSLTNPTTVSPSFTPTVQAECVFSLIITDNNGYSSSPDSVVITATQQPVANAGADSYVPVNVNYSLDGSTSSGVAPVIYSWTINDDLCFPGGSLTNPNTDSPSFTPTVEDQCIFSLVITDGNGYSSDADSVVITATPAPLANAGPNAGVPINAVYTLNGSSSTGISPLTYQWSVTDSTCLNGGSLSSTSVFNPSFTPSIEGQCVFSLVVTDNNGYSSPADSVIITATAAPVANAGSDFNAPVNTSINLDGSASAGISPLEFSWTVDNDSCFPGGSLSDATSDSPTFIATSESQCVFSLVVTDSNGYSSAADSVIVTATQAAVANAGIDSNAPVNMLYSLDGSTSSGVEPLVFSWTISNDACFPGGVLTDPSTDSPSFTPTTTAGSCIFSLVVTDANGFISASDTVTINPTISLTWSTDNEGFSGGGYNFAFHPSQDHIFAYNSANTYESTNDGATWNYTNNISGDPTNENAKYSPSNSSIMYVPWGRDLFKSYNGGSSWVLVEQVSSNDENISAIAIHPTDENILYVGTRNEGMYNSIDGGESWLQISNGLPIGDERVVDIVITENEPTVIYAVLEEEGIYKSIDSGANWDLINSGHSIRTVDMELIQSDGNTIFAGEDTRLFKSTDRGENWSQLYIFPRMIERIIVNPDQTTDIIVTIENAIYKSSDGGSSFTSVYSHYTRLFAFWEGHISNCEYKPTDSSILLCATEGSGLLKSSDGGDTWSFSNQGLPAYSKTYAYSIAGDYLYSGSSTTYAKFGSNDWEDKQDTKNDGGIHDIATDPNDNNVVWYASYKLFRSSNNFDTVLERFDNNTLAFSVISTVDVAGQTHIYAGNFDGEMFKSTDGTTWNELADGFNSSEIKAITVDNSDPTKVFIATNGQGIYYSTDSGTSWTHSGQNFRIASIAIDPNNSNVIYAGANHELYKSIDGGLNWSIIATPGGEVSSIVFDPTDSAIVYAVSRREHIMYTVDSGSTWTEMQYNLQGESHGTTDIFFRPGDNDTLYVGTRWLGLFKAAITR